MMTIKVKITMNVTITIVNWQ